MFENIAVKDALNMVCEERAILLDLRDEESYNRGHLPMAEQMDFEKLQSGEIILERDIPIIFYCEHGSTSMLAAKWLSEQGYTTYSIVGGYTFYKGYIEKQREIDNIWTMELK